ncbi:hypothetical protein [Maribacter sp. 2307ULW6-5]|uniref:hypothetical protein n=1 Tax=Maribacter sp. 2307ULW6-5 TaxID=3386275 RepID=UPI0039BC608C
MKKTDYTSLKDIDLQLKMLDLRRQIEWEEVKLVQHQVKKDLHHMNFLASLLDGFKKYGLMLLLKKVLR